MWMTGAAGLLTLGAFVKLTLIPAFEPEDKNAYASPFFPLLPALAILTTMILWTGLSQRAWICYAIFHAIGLAIYVFYGHKNS
mmetsp:Transcript_4455/g.3233  ORF Transcript_4455/g.3233 Transcript_4455/m.3233 type:complete len:83 (-) Transcript_4455:119-367(-)